MSALFAAFLNSRIGQAVVAIGAAILAVLTIRAKAKREGAAEERETIRRENARAVETRRKIESEVETRSDDALRDKLRGYRRD